MPPLANVLSRTGIRLHYSNRTERLLDALVENLEARRARGASPLEAVTIVVPNRSVKTYVEFGIARATGIAANLDVTFLRSFLGRVVEEARPDVRIVDGSLLQGLVLSLLHDPELLDHPELRPVRDYLDRGGNDPDARDVRRCQLARQMARLFEEYSYSRPEMLQAWPAKLLIEGDLRETEVWQRRLWLALFARGGLVERRELASGQRWLTTGALGRELRAVQIGGRRDVHLFGLSYVARAYQSIFEALARAARLEIYTLNPCMEFWEDVETIGERIRRVLPRRRERVGEALARDDDPFHLGESEDTPLLRLWGRPGRENIRLLNELTECEFEPRFEDPLKEGITLLRQIQRDVLLREPAHRRPAAPLLLVGDESLTVLACPGVRREAETIASEIWALVRDKEPALAPGGARPERLRFNDIAVIVPGKRASEYQAHLAAVFRETWDLPHNIVDMPIVGESRLAEAAELLLALPFGRFTRQDLLRVATHPSVMGRFPEARAEDWLAWCESLGIVHGGDHRDHLDTYIERDVLNWDQGLRRLALGAFMTGHRSGDARMLALGGQLYPPEESAVGVESAAGLGVLVRSLIEDARFCRAQRMTMREWTVFLQRMLASYLTAISDEDERALGRWLRAIQSLEEVDLEGRAVSYRIPYELARAAAAAASAGRGQHLADGVVISSFLPMRAIPFRVIFVAGLGERDFPSPERPDRLDLRAARRHPGDVSPREQDRYMFLECLLCARDRLYLSYVARDQLTGDRLEPSSVVRELRHLVEQEYLGDGGFAPRIRREPLRRFDPRSFPRRPSQGIVPAVRLAPEATREAQARELGNDLREALAGAPPPADFPALRRALPAGEWMRLAPILGLRGADPRGTLASTEVETVSLSLATLRRFLECPLQGSASARIGLREDDAGDDLLAREDERFETERLDRIVALRAAFVQALRTAAVGAPATALGTVARAVGTGVGAGIEDGPADAVDIALERAHDESTLCLELDGRMPTGLFGAVERDNNLAVLRGWRRALWEHAGGRPGAIRTFRFGRAHSRGQVDEALDPIVLDEVALADGRSVRVEVTGRTQAVLEDRGCSVVLVQRSVCDPARLQRDALRGFLDHVALAAAGRRADREHEVLVAVFPGSPSHAERFDPLSRDEARAWLRALAADLLGAVHDYLLPCEAVFQSRGGSAGDVGAIIEGLRDGEKGFSSDYGPVPEPRNYPVLDPERARAAIERRFGLYFRTRQSDRGGAGGER